MTCAPRCLWDGEVDGVGWAARVAVLIDRANLVGVALARTHRCVGEAGGRAGRGSDDRVGGGTGNRTLYLIGIHSVAAAGRRLPRETDLMRGGRRWSLRGFAKRNNVSSDIRDDCQLTCLISALRMGTYLASEALASGYCDWNVGERGGERAVRERRACNGD